MSVRLNFLGFSLPTMRRLIGSGDAAAVARMRDRLVAGAADSPYRSEAEAYAVAAIVERAVLDGVPFPDVVEESNYHFRAVGLLVDEGQEIVPTLASTYHASAMGELLRQYGKHASRETRAFLRGLAEGVPLFGRRLPDPEDDGMVYALISGAKLRAFRPGLVDLREHVAYRVGRKPDPTEADRGAVSFAADLCDWVDEIEGAGLDLYYCTG